MIELGKIVQHEMREGEESNKVPFLHVRFPSQIHQTLDTAPGTRNYPMGDNVYLKTNSPIFGVGPMGHIEIKKPGTYMLHLDIRIDEVDGDWVCSGMQAFADIEEIDAQPQSQSKEIELMCEAISEDVIDLRKARFHSSSMIHVGDGTFGIDGYGAKMMLRILTEGDYTYSAEMQLTVTKLS